MRPSTRVRHGQPEHPPAHASHPAPHHEEPKKEHVYLTPFQQLLMRAREKFDVIPYMEVAQNTKLAYQAPISNPAATPATLTQTTTTVTPTYGLAWEKMPFMAWDVFPVGNEAFPAGQANDLSAGAFTCLWSTGAFQSQINQSLGFIVTDDAHGTPGDDWVKHPGGVILKRTSAESWEQWQEILQFVAQPISLGTRFLGFPYLWSALRGYKLVGKDTIQPKQKTRQEYLDEGHKLEKFTYIGPVTVTMVAGTGAGANYVNTPGALRSFQLNFNSPKADGADFLLESIRIRPQSLPSTDLLPYIDTIGVGLESSAAPGLQLQGTSSLLASGAQQKILFPWRMALGAQINVSQTVQPGVPPIVQQLRSQWDLPIGLTIPYNARWNLLAQPLISFATGYTGGSDFNPNVTMEFALEGELILPKE